MSDHLFQSVEMATDFLSPMSNVTFLSLDKVMAFLILQVAGSYVEREASGSAYETVISPDVLTSAAFM